MGQRWSHKAPGAVNRCHVLQLIQAGHCSQVLGHQHAYNRRARSARWVRRANRQRLERGRSGRGGRSPDTPSAPPPPPPPSSPRPDRPSKRMGGCLEAPCSSLVRRFLDSGSSLQPRCAGSAMMERSAECIEPCDGCWQAMRAQHACSAAKLRVTSCLPAAVAGHVAALLVALA